MSPILEDDRLPPDRMIAREILQGDQPAAPHHLGHDEVRDPPAVESVGAAVTDRLEGGGEVGLPEQRTRGGRSAVGQEARARRRERREPRAVPADGLASVVVDDEPVAGQPDRRLDDPAEREPPVATMGFDQAGDGARHARRQVPGDAAVRGLALRVQIHVAHRSRRRGLPIVERVDRPVAQADHHEAATAEIAGLGVHHRQREADGHGGIRGVAALAQDVAPDAAREAAARDHHRVLTPRHARLPRVGPARRDADRRGGGRRPGAGSAADAQGDQHGEYDQTHESLEERSVVAAGG